MRSVLILMMFSVSLAHAAGNEYEEVRNLDLSAEGISTLEIEAGAGSLQVIGVSGTDDIVVTAIIQVAEDDDDKARKEIDAGLVLSLEKSGDNALLKSYFEGGFMNFGDSPRVQLEVRVPERLALNIDDGSGSIVVQSVSGNIELEDDSGSIMLTNVGGDVEIDDGSGSINVDGVNGDLVIGDGSGSIKVRDVTGSVTVDDGSGSINVTDVEADLIIENDGSGSLNFSNIGGQVETDG
jgi:hypothetical protein